MAVISDLFQASAVSHTAFRPREFCEVSPHRHLGPYYRYGTTRTRGKGLWHTGTRGYGTTGTRGYGLVHWCRGLFEAEFALGLGISKINS